MGRFKGEADALSGFARDGKSRSLEATQDSVANKEARRQRATDCPFADPARQARSARGEPTGERANHGRFALGLQAKRDCAALKVAAAGRPFFWILFFGRAKIKYLAFRCENRS